MKKIILLLLALSASKAFAQVDWTNYSTSFQQSKNASLGVAVPYNGIYDNFSRKTVGIAHWNPQDKIHIDSNVSDSIPLIFVYDTAGIYFLAPDVTRDNAEEFEFIVLLNNKTIVSSWSHIDQFTQVEIGGMKAGGGIMGAYRADWGNYLVAHLRNKKGKIISSWVVYWRQQLLQVASIYTSNSPLEFSKIVNNKDQFNNQPAEIGWHRQYRGGVIDEKRALRFPHNENNLLLNIDAEIFRKEALQYSVIRDGEEIRKLQENEYDNSFIFLKDLQAGKYTIRMRLTRQPDSIMELHFDITPIWYNTAIFRIVCFAFVALLLALGYILVRYRRQKLSLRKANTKFEQTAGELKSIHALLNPHFTFNALSSIQSLINKNDIDSANKYLSSFGELLRETLKESRFDLIPLEKELKNMKMYIELEQLRSNFNVNIEVDNSIDVNTAQIPPFLMQPFIENAIKHSLSMTNAKGMLYIHVGKREETMLVSIEDNGAGFNVSSCKEGHGLALSKRRVKLLNREYKEEMIQLQIESNNLGTKISITFLNWLDVEGNNH